MPTGSQPCCVLDALHQSSHLVFKITVWDRYDQPNSTNEETKWSQMPYKDLEEMARSLWNIM